MQSVLFGGEYKLHRAPADLPLRSKQAICAYLALLHSRFQTNTLEPHQMLEVARSRPTRRYELNLGTEPPTAAGSFLLVLEINVQSLHGSYL